MNAFDLFAGAGGLSLGMEKAGITVKWANEIDSNACETYRNSHPNTTLFMEDANILLTRLICGDENLPKPGDVDVIAGGPPCQGFSGYNRFRNPDDPRNSLMETFLAFVDYLKPRYVLLENVPGMLSLAGGATPRLLLTTLNELGYNTRLGILQAGYYGLPQNRWRVFIWGSYGDLSIPAFPLPKYNFPRTTIFGATQFRDSVIKPIKGDNGLLPFITVGDAISDLPRIENGSGIEEVIYESEPLSDYQKILRNEKGLTYNHVTNRLGTIQYERCLALSNKNGSGWNDLPEELKPRNLLKYGDSRYGNRFGKLSEDGVFNTILSRPYPYWSAVFHPNQDRVISVRESARAQSFPDSVRFYGKRSSQYRQIGNAVPVLLAYEIFSMLK
ncbi:DNA cytosine methyltransferase [Succiniclasticum ruminis]|uniref:Cytosine-specific methyltransferase n=1 Tax=Succiniclasticum ruminis DSM 9236 TaxID=1123323 RepID=A0A1I2E5S5_9FIRM|nr:DNA cytosine methyltransferase [Succiniclasticum ruminis]SFE88294.1 DNA (cytosine-5)-methyltransferase 1 [Succiniclasticum ruminis DSM 9236]